MGFCLQSLGCKHNEWGFHMRTLKMHVTEFSLTNFRPHLGSAHKDWSSSALSLPLDTINDHGVSETRKRMGTGPGGHSPGKPPPQAVHTCPQIPR